MRAEIIDMVKVLIEVTQDIFIKTKDGIYGIREGGGNLEIRKEGNIVWSSERQSLSIRDMEIILSWYKYLHGNDCSNDEEKELADILTKALKHRLELQDESH